MRVFNQKVTIQVGWHSRVYFFQMLALLRRGAENIPT